MALCGFGPIGFAPVGGAELSLPPVGFLETPEDLFPGYAWDGTDLKIPLTTLDDHGLTAALANATTGDPRTIFYALAARAEEWLKDLATDDMPKALTVRPRASIIQTTGVFAGKERITLSFTIYRDRPEGTIAEEPPA